MTIGYDRPLYVLPFDHRATFAKNMFGWREPLTPEQTAEVAAVKQVIYDGFKSMFSWPFGSSAPAAARECSSTL